MAKNSVKGNDEMAQGLSNIVKIQRDINSDYIKLADDYKKLAIRIWNIPTMKYIFGGLAAGAVLPYALKGVNLLKGAVTEKVQERRLQNKIEDLKNHFGHVGDELPKS